MNKNYNATTADTYEYTGYSVTVPAHQIFEIMGSDRYKDANPTAIAITSTNVSPDTSQYANVYAESAGNTAANKAFASRTVTVLTPYSDNDVTYYFFVKHNTTSSNPISLAYRRIM